MSNKPGFSTFFSLSQYSSFQNHLTRNPGSKADANDPTYQAWLEEYRNHTLAIQEALGSFLSALRDHGSLAPIDFTEGRGHRWANCWNRFVTGTDEQGWDKLTICRSISKSFTWRVRDGQSIESGYAERVEPIDAGRLEWWEIADAYSECDATGQLLHLQIETGWKPRLGTVDRQGHESTFKPLTGGLPPPCVFSLEIPAPTGEMIVADWFRLEDNLFTKIVKDSDGGSSVNTSYGAARATERYAKEFGFMSVFVGSTSPSIVVRGDHVLIASLDEDLNVKVKGEILGSVCTDLWWVTMIDRQVLVDIVARKLGRAEAEKRVAEYLETSLRNSEVTIVKQPPGSLYFHHRSSRCDLGDFVCTGPTVINQDAVITPYAVISKVPLDFKLRTEIVEAPVPGSPKKIKLR